MCLFLLAEGDSYLYCSVCCLSFKITWSVYPLLFFPTYLFLCLVSPLSPSLVLFSSVHPCEECF